MMDLFDEHGAQGTPAGRAIANPFEPGRVAAALLSVLLVAMLLVACQCERRDEPRAGAAADSGRRSVRELAGPWQFRASRLAGTAPRGALGEWMPAMVPGTVHTDLLAAGKIPDPFVGTHERELQWIGESDWEYRAILRGDAALLSRESIELVFEGLDTFAAVLLNGHVILQADNMFREWRVPVKRWLREGDNDLIVRFRSPLEAGKVALARHGYPLPASNDLGEPKVSMFTRKAPYHYGWDWGPRLVTSGLWRPVLLEAWAGARISDLHVRTESLNDARAELSVIATIEAARAGRAEIDLSLASGGALASWSGELVEGHNRVQIRARIERPERWWPNGLGEPHLYTLSAALSFEGSERDLQSVRLGLRELRVEHQADASGKSFRVIVNGAPVFMKGANYIPEDSFLPRAGRARHEQVLRAAAGAHMNMLRVWGGGVYADDSFYDLADELGILLWQDFMFACSLYPGNEAFLQNVRQEARETVRRLRNHPSLALWAGNNEIEWAWRDWGWQEALSPKQREEARLSYRRLFGEVLPEIVAVEDPDRFYTQSSPSANDDRIAPNQIGHGDMHYWGVWGAGEPYENYAKNVSRFMSEYGFQSFPEPATIKSFASGADYALDSEVMRAHQRHPRGQELLESYMERDFRPPKDFDSFLYVSQVLQATIVEFAATVHRRRMPFNWGSLYWQLNDCWPVASWSSIDYFGRWKALHHRARRFFAPVLASAVEQGDQLRVYGVSDHRNDRAARLELRLMDFDGRVSYRAARDFTLLANTSQPYFEVPLAELLGGANRREVALLIELRQGNEPVARSVHYFVKAKELALEEPGLVLEQLSRGDQRTELRISARRLARAVMLSSDDVEGRFSDNYFDVLPGEPIELTFAGHRGARIEVRSLRDTYVEPLKK